MTKHVAKLDALQPYPDNPRKHSRAHVRDIAKSLAEFGWGRPVVVDEGDMILGGHGAVLAAKYMRDEGYVIPNWQDPDKCPVRVMVGLTPAQKRAFVLADNKLTIMGDWDEDALAEEIERLKREDPGDLVATTGFSEAEIVKLLQAPANVPAARPVVSGEVQHVVTVECDDEDQQREVYDDLTARGLTCKIQSL